MYFYNNHFAELASRARDGDYEAQEQLRLELEDAMVLMVRQTLRDGRGTTSIARRVLSVARRLMAEQAGVTLQNADDFVREVAHNVCEEVIARLQPCPGGPSAGESFNHAAHGATLLMR